MKKVIMCVLVVVAAISVSYAERYPSFLGAVIPVQLITGADVPTMGNGSVPIWMKTTEPLNIPYYDQVQDYDCTLSGEARGDIASGRVYLDLVSMVCTSRSNKAKREFVVSGFAAEKGTNGISGDVAVKDASKTILKSFGYTLKGNGEYAQKLLEQASPVIVIKPETKAEIVFLVVEDKENRAITFDDAVGINSGEKEATLPDEIRCARQLFPYLLGVREFHKPTYDVVVDTIKLVDLSACEALAYHYIITGGDIKKSTKE